MKNPNKSAASAKMMCINPNSMVRGPTFMWYFRRLGCLNSGEVTAEVAKNTSVMRPNHTYSGCPKTKSTKTIQITLGEGFEPPSPLGHRLT